MMTTSVLAQFDKFTVAYIKLHSPPPKICFYPRVLYLIESTTVFVSCFYFTDNSLVLGRVKIRVISKDDMTVVIAVEDMKTGQNPMYPCPVKTSSNCISGTHV